jgi:hypothetical protein
MYSALADGVLLLHLLFIFWVIFGAVVAFRHPMLRWIHIVCLVWGILTELLPWPCPLTLLENWLEARAGVTPYQGGFLLHYLTRSSIRTFLPCCSQSRGLWCAPRTSHFMALFLRARDGVISNVEKAGERCRR